MACSHSSAVLFNLDKADLASSLRRMTIGSTTNMIKELMMAVVDKTKKT